MESQSTKLKKKKLSSPKQGQDFFPVLQCVQYNGAILRSFLSYIDVSYFAHIKCNKNSKPSAHWLLNIIKLLVFTFRNVVPGHCEDEKPTVKPDTLCSNFCLKISITTKHIEMTLHISCNRESDAENSLLIRPFTNSFIDGSCKNCIISPIQTHGFGSSK